MKDATAIAKDRMDVLELLRKEGRNANLDSLREGLQMLLRAVMEIEMTLAPGACQGRGDLVPRGVVTRLRGPLSLRRLQARNNQTHKVEKRRPSVPHRSEVGR